MTAATTAGRRRRGGLPAAPLALCLLLLQCAPPPSSGHLRGVHDGHGHDHGDHHHDHHHHDHFHDHHHDHRHDHRSHGHRRADALEPDHSSGEEHYADVFDSCFVPCHEDIVDRYGAAFADRLAADGFKYDRCDAAAAAGNSTPYYANGTDDPAGAASPQQRALSRVLGATDQLHRLWSVPSYRGSDGRLRIPYAIKSSSWFDDEARTTIAEAMGTIENATGVVRFVPRTPTYGQREYVYFNHEAHYERSCAANMGRRTGQRTNVFLGWCRRRRHVGNVVHKLLHALGFWHEHSRPDRDDHVRIAMDLVMPNARNNFAKATAVNSLGSPYDFGSIMHYPPVSFSKDGRTPTIIPREPLERWETMGQRAQLSRRDVEQLRLLYQCATGPRAGGAGVDELCSTDCKCWEHAMGDCHGDDDECVGDLVCRPTPNLLAKKHEDRLPYYASRGGSFSCDDYCHPDCCHFANGRVRCPETCDSAPPAETVGEVPTQMCVKQHGGGDVTTTTTTTTTSTTTTTTTTTTSTTMTTTTSNPIHPTAPWYVKWGIDKCVQHCEGPPPCGGLADQAQEFHSSVHSCCNKWLHYKDFDDCHTVPEGVHIATMGPTGSPTEGPTMGPSQSPTEGPTDTPSTGPSKSPSKSPTRPPTKAPVTESPTDAPTTSGAPTALPSVRPSYEPTETVEPSEKPTEGPTTGPTDNPTKSPTEKPTTQPTKEPSHSPTEKPTNQPVSASGDWYIDWDINKCVRDCIGERPCRSRRKKTWESGYSTVQGCCNNMPYMPFKQCSYEPSMEERGGGAGASNKWYPGASECQNDGNEPAWQHNLHDSQSTCCRSHFNWNYNICMGITPAVSRKWFINWVKGKCVMECNESEGGSCGGLVPGSWTVMHNDVNACCRTHMSYVSVEDCKFNG